MLYVDAGNTRIKWGLHDGAGWIARGTLAHGQVPQLATQLQGVTEASVASVAGHQVDAALQTVFDASGIAACWIKASASACGVVNGYAQPEQLGCDRWAALIAAWKLKRSACVVATAGTALTVDALSARGEFLGGLIVPGLALLQAALSASTAGVHKLDGGLADFPADTGDAVYSGALVAMAGSVRHMLKMLADREGIEPALLVSGGDAPALQTALSGAGEIVDNLVLEGLLLIAKGAE
jgi:type III pantothenate kinase